MRNTLIAFFIMISTFANAQRIDFDKGSVTVYSDVLTIQESFELTDKLLPWRSRFYDRYVVSNGVTYYRPGLRFIRKPRVYVVEANGNLRRI